jgi:methanogenic corrinoid protein MtbC1
VREIGDRWANDRLAIAAEHLATAVLRSMLGGALQPSVASLLGPKIVFATMTGERHELGLQMAAVTALGAGANPVYLGADLPMDELLAAVDVAGALVVALSFVSMPVEQAIRSIAAIRAALPPEVHLWIGGAAASEAEPPAGVERLATLKDLEQRVALLAVDRRRTG